MCTAISLKSKYHYFGRNLDLDRGYDERVVITPEFFPLKFINQEAIETHYSMIGMACVAKDYPLYFEATNSVGLSAAGLNFPGNAVYNNYAEDKINIASYEFIPFILSQCSDVSEAEFLLRKINITADAFSCKLKPTPLHWIIADADRSITVEPLAKELKIYDNPFGVLTNNPTFDFHIQNINNYMHLSEGAAFNRLSKNLEFNNYSLGMGALGLPGDYSSVSRFVRGVFIKVKSKCGKFENESVCQFFHILDGVSMPYGCVLTEKGEYEFTRYSSCCNTKKGIYYYKTYNCFLPFAVDMNSFNLKSDKLIEICFEDEFIVRKSLEKDNSSLYNYKKE